MVPAGWEKKGKAGADVLFEDPARRWAGGGRTLIQAVTWALWRVLCCSLKMRSHKREERWGIGVQGGLWACRRLLQCSSEAQPTCGCEDVAGKQRGLEGAYRARPVVLQRISNMLLVSQHMHYDDDHHHHIHHHSHHRHHICPSTFHLASTNSALSLLNPIQWVLKGELMPVFIFETGRAAEGWKLGTFDLGNN